jgi:hypothetical protein
MNGNKGSMGATGADGTEVDGMKGFKGDYGSTGPAGPQGLAGPTGAAGYNDVTTIYQGNWANSWSKTKAKYDRAVADFDTYQDSCDSRMARFDQINADIALLMPDLDELDTQMASKLQMAKDGVNAGQAIKQSEFMSNLTDEYEYTQELITYLLAQVTSVLASRGTPVTTPMP